MGITTKNSPLVFLEAHNIQNMQKGIGVFNFELIKAFTTVNTDFRMMVNMADKSLMKHFNSPLMFFHKYCSLQRKPLFRIRQKADIWHSLNQNTKIEPYRDTNYVLTIHDIILLKQEENHKLLINKIHRANAITYISKFIQNDVHNNFEIPPHVKEYVIYNGNTITKTLDTSNFQPIDAAKSPYLYAIGDFQERKNFHSLVEMMRVTPDFKLIISGQNKSDYAQKIKDLIQKHNLQEKVFLTGTISEEAKQYYFKNATAFLFPSTEEGFGLPIIEAMNFGKPVFLSTKSCIPEIGGKDAFYFDNFDPEYMCSQLTNGLNYFNDNKDEMEQKLIARAQSFSWKNSAKEYLKVYTDVLS